VRVHVNVRVNLYFCIFVPPGGGLL
jgi:hypothetical protein